MHCTVSIVGRQSLILECWNGNERDKTRVVSCGTEVHLQDSAMPTEQTITAMRISNCTVAILDSLGLLDVKK